MEVVCTNCIGNECEFCRGKGIIDLDDKSNLGIKYLKFSIERGNTVENYKKSLEFMRGCNFKFSNYNSSNES